MNDFYEKLKSFTEASDDLSETEKAVVLFRVALENNASEVGLVSSMYLMSKLMTATLGIMADEEDSFEKNFPDLDENEMTRH